MGAGRGDVRSGEGVLSGVVRLRGRGEDDAIVVANPVGRAETAAMITAEAPRADTPAIPAAEAPRADTAALPTAQALRPGTTAIPTAEAPRADTAALPTAQALRPGTTAIPTAEAPRADTVALPTAEAPRADTAALPTAQALRPGTTAIPTAEAPRADTAALPTAEAPRADTAALPTAQALRPGTTAIPAAEAPRADTAALPTAQALRPGTTAIPTAEAPRADTAALPTAEASRAGTTAIPTAEAPRADTAALPTAEASRAGTVAGVGGLALARVKTAEGGGFHFVVLPAGRYVLTATGHDEGSAASVEIDIPDGRDRHGQVLDLQATGSGVFGRVLDSVAGGISRARVRARRVAGAGREALVFEAESGCLGRFRLSLPPDHYSFEVEADGYGSTRFSLEVPTALVRTFVLYPEIDGVAGRVHLDNEEQALPPQSLAPHPGPARMNP